MLTLEYLKEQVPAAEAILRDAAAAFCDEMPQLSSGMPKDISGDILCKEGVSLSFYEQRAKPWLDAKKGRRLFWIEHLPNRLAALVQGDAGLGLLTDRRSRIFYYQTPQQKEWIVKKIGWLAAFQEIVVLSEEWKPLLEEAARTAQLIVSDAADFGTKVASHFKSNLRKPLRHLGALQGTMKGIPAIVCGAGPSLEMNGHLLKEWQDKALLIAAGHAIQTMNTRPDLAVAFDPNEPIEKTRYADAPLCLQGRTHPTTVKNFNGEKLYFPDSHFPFEAWLTQTRSLNTGWTVGNAAVAIAVELGCNPIILVGMDYCYRGKQKYAAGGQGKGEARLFRAVDQKGREVWTQSDWLMAVQWMEEMAMSHPELDFYNASAEGMEIGSPFQTASLDALRSSVSGVQEQWKKALLTAPLVEWPRERVEAWKASLLALDQVACEQLLEPLWRIWSHLFERELMVDPHPIPMSEKLEIQKKLFFQQVIEEHLSNLSQ